MKKIFIAVCLFLILFPSLGSAEANALQPGGNRLMKITLIPDYVNGTIRFDGQIDVGEAAGSLDWEGLPLIVEHEWKEEASTVWTITGRVRDGKLEQDSESPSYRLVLGPIQLQPGDRLSLVIPFVNLDYAQIEPPADAPDHLDEISRRRTHLFTYAAGDAVRDLPRLVIPFSPVVMKADLSLVPLVGEALAGKASGLRLSGRVRFENIMDFDVFSRYCQITSERLQNGDTRAAHLQYNLDFPAHYDPDVLDPIYRIKPTRMALRTEMSSCQYDEEEGVGEVAATFSGRIIDIIQDPRAYPSEQLGSAIPDGNYSFSPELGSRAVQGYVIQLGKIFLAPGDVLTITMPNAQVQAGALTPVPSAYENSGDLRIVYTGPLSFELSLPYIPQSNLFASQFPAIMRPGISAIEDQLQDFYPWDGSGPAWIALVSGLVLLLLSGSILKVRWLFLAGWLLIAIGFFYGVRGSFGLLSTAVAFYTARFSIPGSTSPKRVGTVRDIVKGLGCFALIALAVYLDSEGTAYFRGLSGPELSPLTPVILLLLVGALFLVLYGRPGASQSFARADLPVLIVFLAVLSLYDAFDKSLLALLLLFTGILVILRPVSRSKGSGARQNEPKLGNGFRRRWKLAVGNRLVLFAVLILIMFAVLNDLSSTYANEIQVLLPPLIAPLVISVLVFVSVFVTFSSIAVLFVLVYPFLPWKNGYLKAAVFSLGLFLVFLFGIGTDDRLIASLPDILVGRVIYYVSVPMLIGVYLDIHEFRQRENKQRSGEGAEGKEMDFRAASSMYFKNLRGIMGTLASIVSLVAPTVYAFLSSQPVIVTYFDLLEKLVLLPV